MTSDEVPKKSRYLSNRVLAKSTSLPENINNVYFGPCSEILEDTFNQVLGNEIDQVSPYANMGSKAKNFFLQ